MKRILLSLLVILLILGALGAAGFAGYQYGYRQGAVASSNGNALVNPRNGNVGPRGMPMHNFGFNHGFGMMRRGFGFGFLSPLFLLARLAFWALVIWALYMLIARSGWRLTKTPPAIVTPPPSSTTTTTTTAETHEDTPQD